MLEIVVLQRTEALGLLAFLNGQVLAQEGELFLLPLVTLQELIAQHGRVITDWLHITTE